MMGGMPHNPCIAEFSLDVFSSPEVARLAGHVAAKWQWRRILGLCCACSRGTCANQIFTVKYSIGKVAVAVVVISQGQGKEEKEEAQLWDVELLWLMK